MHRRQFIAGTPVYIVWPDRVISGTVTDLSPEQRAGFTEAALADMVVVQSGEELLRPSRQDVCSTRQEAVQRVMERCREDIAEVTERAGKMMQELCNA